MTMTTPHQVSVLKIKKTSKGSYLGLFIFVKKIIVTLSLLIHCWANEIHL
jgi:hypothetical protein